MAPRASDVSDGSSTGFLLSRVGARVRRALVVALADHELKPLHYGVLAELGARGPLSQQQLSNAHGVDRSDMVAIIDELEQRSLVERARDPGDRRRHAITLTARGRTTLRELDRVVARVNDAFFASLSARERTELSRLLLKIRSLDEPDA